MSQIHINKMVDNIGAISNQQRCQNPLPVRCQSVISTCLKASKVGVNSDRPSIVSSNQRAAN